MIYKVEVEVTEAAWGRLASIADRRGVAIIDVIGTAVVKEIKSDARKRKPISNLELMTNEIQQARRAGHKGTRSPHQESRMTIAALVTELAVHTTDGEHYGPPLLEQLWQARGGSVGFTVTGATAPASRAAFNIDAHNLWYQTVEMTGLMYSGATGQAGSKNPILNLLSWLPVFVSDCESGEANPIQQAVALERMMKWADDIRNLIDPPKSGPLNDVQCPNCGAYRVTVGDGDEAVEGPALAWSYRAGEEMTASCRDPFCLDPINWAPSQWVGDTAIIQLGRLSGQSIDVDKIRDSRVPVEEIPYESGEKVTVTPEDATYAAELREVAP